MKAAAASGCEAVVCFNKEWERWPTQKKAKEECGERRKTLAAKGFLYSDMEM